MGKRYYGAVGFRLIVFKIFVKIKRIFGAHRGLRSKWYYLPCPITIVTEDHIAMHVPALNVGGPFKADKGGEFVWLIKFFSCIDYIIPNRRITP